MKTACAKWKEKLLDTALTGKTDGALEQHLAECALCAQELAVLRARREELDALLPEVARAGELSPDFRARVLAQADATQKSGRRRSWWTWALAGAGLAGAAAVLVAVLWHGKTANPAPGSVDVAAAQKLAEWRAPSDVLLATPGRDFLRTTPKLGESYLRVPAKRNEEE